MINFFRLEQKFKNIDLKVISVKEELIENYYYYIIEYEFNLLYNGNKFGFIDKTKSIITENMYYAILNKIKKFHKEYLGEEYENVL